MTGKSKALLLLSILIYFFLLAGLSLSKLNTADSATYSRETPMVKAKLVQLDETRKRKAKVTFEEMCEFLKLDDKQTESARKLFEGRLREMDVYLTSMSKGELDRKEVHLKLVESFKKYRKQFEEMLNEKQKERLSLWEGQGTSRGKKNKTPRG